MAHDFNNNNDYAFGYMPCLDGLRGIATAAVIAFHASEQGLFKGAFIGVDMFFMLSGFLITALILHPRIAGKGFMLRAFYIRRVVRLLSGLLPLLILYCLFSALFVSQDQLTSNLIDAFIVATFQTNWARAFNIHAPQHLGHLWSLALELQFYLVWPLFIRNVSKKDFPHAILFIVITVFAISGYRFYLAFENTPIVRIYNGFDTRIDGFLLGGALAFLLYSGCLTRPYVRVVAANLSPWAWSVALLMVFHFSLTEYWVQVVVFPAAAIVTCCILVDLLINPLGAAAKALSNRAIVLIGKVSYGLYLWHYPIFIFLRRRSFSDFDVFWVGAGLSIVAAVISYNYIERPLIRMFR